MYSSTMKFFFSECRLSFVNSLVAAMHKRKHPFFKFEIFLDHE